MTYEFHAGDAASNDFPNPFKLENIFLLLSSTALIIGGIFVLLDARNYFQSHQDKLATVTVMLAVSLFGVAVKFLIQALTHIRFYLGRKFPAGLADELPTASYGLGKGALDVMNVLRQGAIDFPEPAGPLNGVLYSLIKPLITSPPPIQAAAVQHFHSLVAMAGLLASMCASYFFVTGTAYEGVVSWMYLPMTGLSLLTPFMRSETEDFNASHVGDADKMLWKLIGLVVFSIIAPVAIPRYLPAYPIPPMWVAPLLLLLTSMVASVVFLLSLLAQLDEVSQTSVSCEQTTISMNCHPAQLWPKVSRDFQSSWVRNIPNRAYANVPPGATDSDRGAFQGYILEETQPTTSSTMGLSKPADVFGAKHVRYLALLNVWGLLLSIAAAAVAAHFASAFASMERMEISRVILIAIALTVATALTFRIGHLLWSRMYFKSRLMWIVIDGTFQDAELRVGNQFTGNMQSRSTLTRVEDATLRVWVSDIVSVAFGKGGKRFLMALAPADGFAKATADGLKQFALNQSSVTTPTSIGDFAKAQSVAAMSQAIGMPGEAALMQFMKSQSLQAG